MAKYGFPYMGSKQSIADQICPLFPKADNFYDLFGGGFSMTHAMHIKRRTSFKQFHFNEIKSDVVELIKKAIAGEFNYQIFKPKFISRQDFFNGLDDPYIRCVWSFGNNQKGYLFSKEIEPYKKSMHNAIVFNEFDELAKKVFSHDGFKEGYFIGSRRLFLRNRIEYFRLNGIPDFLFPFLNEKQLNNLLGDPKGSYQLQHLGRLERLQQLEQLQHLGRLERLQQLEQLEQLQQLQQFEFYSDSYDKIEIKDNSIIYCDPPYKGTADYSNKQNFDHDRFLNWASTHNTPIFISEYNIDDKRFRLIKTIKKAKLLDNSKDKKDFAVEKIYINNAAIKKFC